MERVPPAESNLPSAKSTHAPKTEPPVLLPLRDPWPKRIMRFSVMWLLFLIVLRLGWGWYAHHHLQAEIDRIVAAGEPLYPEDFDSPPVPDDQNAAILLKQAAESLQLTKEQKNALPIFKKNQPMDDEELETTRLIIENNQTAIALARSARSRPSANWGMRFQRPAIFTLLPLLAPQRDLAKVLSLASRQRHQHGGDQESLDIVLDMLAQSRQLDRHPSLIAHLIALAMDGLTADTILEIAPELNVSGLGNDDQTGNQSAASLGQIRQVIDVLLDDESWCEGSRRALLCERMFQLDCVQMLMGGDWSYSDLMNFDNVSGNKSHMWGRIVSSPFLPLFEMDGWYMLRHMNGMIEVCRQPTWPIADGIVGPLERSANIYRSAMIQFAPRLRYILLPSLSRFIQQNYTVAAKRRQAAIALAVRCYMIKYGNKPDKLTDLVPEFLPAVPIDPMSNDASLYTWARLPFNFWPADSE